MYLQIQVENCNPKVYTNVTFEEAKHILQLWKNDYEIVGLYISKSHFCIDGYHYFMKEKGTN